VSNARTYASASGENLPDPVENLRAREECSFLQDLAIHLAGRQTCSSEEERRAYDVDVATAFSSKRIETWPVLSSGSGADHTPAVQALHTALQARGFPCGADDVEAGCFGDSTAAAVVSFQIHAGLQCTSVCDLQTWRALFMGEAEAERWWLEQGATATDLRAIAAALKCTPYWAPNVASAKIQRLQQVLPGVAVPEMILKEPLNLLVSIDDAVACMVELTSLLPGKDVFALMALQPSLLRCDDIPERVAIVDRKLKEWAPKVDWCDLVSQHPELLQRIPDYYKDKSVHELPVYFLNLISIGGGGAGAAWREFGFTRGQ